MLKTWLDDIPNPNTRRTRENGIKALAAHLRQPVDEAVKTLLSSGPRFARTYHSHLEREVQARAERRGGMAPKTAAAHWSAVMWLLKQARLDEVIDWTVEVTHAIRAVREIEPEELTDEDVQALLGAIDTKSAIGIRDAAIFYTLLGTGLRSFEFLGLQVGDVDLASGSLSYLPKGKTTRQLMPIDGPALDGLARYMKTCRSGAPGNAPAIIGFDEITSQDGRHAPGKVLSYDRLNEIVGAVSLMAGLLSREGSQVGQPRRISPHDLRAYFITKADERGVDAQVAARHADNATTKLYLRNIARTQRRASRLVSAGLPSVA